MACEGKLSKQMGQSRVVDEDEADEDDEDDEDEDEVPETDDRKKL